MMLYINNRNTNPYFNLAVEEYLLKNSDKDFFMIWQNEPSIIIGKHQNVWAEINQEFVDDRDIKIVRRYTGGGAVYHDDGNINLSFIANSDSRDFSRFTKEIQKFLESIGAYTEANERGALTIDGGKISGSAQCIHRKRIIHHATLLFSSKLEDVTRALNGNGKLIENNSKYVKSVRSSVVNISDCLSSPLNIDEFKNKILEYFMSSNNSSINYEFTASDVEAINELSRERYATDVWTFNEK